MRVLVYPRDLELGGSSINAVDLAGAMRDRGHDVFVLARSGPLDGRVRSSGLPLLLVEHPDAPRPSRAAVRAIAAAVRRYRIDLVHTYEFWTCVEAFYGAGVRPGVPILGTVMTMGLAAYLPESVALTVGYRDLLDTARARRSAPVHLLEPPVDTSTDRMGADVGDVDERWELDPTALTVVIVSRAAVAMKQEGIERAMDAVAELRGSVRAQLVVVGGGSAFESLQAHAEQINRSHDERVVVMTGPLSDPRSAYAAADLVVGMGSSVLRGMAFGKAAVVVGERGFSLPVTPDTLPVFDRTGFYGVGAGRPAPADDPLVEQLAGLLGDAGLRAELGRFGAELVHERFSLESVARRLDGIYADTAGRGPGRIRRGADAVGTAGRIVRHKASGRVALLRTGGG